MVGLKRRWVGISLQPTIFQRNGGFRYRSTHPTVTFYNAYCFSVSVNELVYNPTLVLYFLKHFQRYCQFPQQMLDDNLAMDLGKLKKSLVKIRLYHTSV